MHSFRDLQKPSCFTPLFGNHYFYLRLLELTNLSNQLEVRVDQLGLYLASSNNSSIILDASMVSPEEKRRKVNILRIKPLSSSD